MRSVYDQQQREQRLGRALSVRIANFVDFFLKIKLSAVIVANGDVRVYVKDC